jgi:hypothetical protein
MALKETLMLILIQIFSNLLFRSLVIRTINMKELIIVK